MAQSMHDDAPQFQGPCTRPELAKALPRWDRLGTSERAKLEGHAAGCAYCGPALTLLREAEDWLVAQAPNRPLGPCPTPDDLFDFGRGPGARPMLAERRSSIEEHLGQCVECESLVATLATKPPSPLILESEPAPEVAGAPTPSGLSRRPRRLRALAAAAAVAAVSFFAWSEIQAAAPSGWSAVQFPAAELMRGEEAGRLLFPRNRVLPATDGPRFGSGLVFELSSEVRGESYRISVARHTGGAFDAGTPVFELSAGTPLLRPSPEQLSLLSPGDYTWEAWAQIDGLDVQLGRRDFHVQDDADLAARLEAVADRPHLERVSRQLTLLWEHGYRADARALARALPESSARDQFLDRTPDL